LCVACGNSHTALHIQASNQATLFSPKLVLTSTPKAKKRSSSTADHRENTDTKVLKENNSLVPDPVEGDAGSEAAPKKGGVDEAR